MSILDKIKEGLFQGSEKISDATEKMLEKAERWAPRALKLPVTFSRPSVREHPMLRRWRN